LQKLADSGEVSRKAWLGMKGTCVAHHLHCQRITLVARREYTQGVKSEMWQTCRCLFAAVGHGGAWAPQPAS
jgi:hypothetical protein